MSKRDEVAQDVAEQVTALQTAIDDAMAKAAELRTILLARAEALPPLPIGDGPYDTAGSTFTALVEARRRIGEFSDLFEGALASERAGDADGARSGPLH
jgi:hypothetical protein